MTDYKCPGKVIAELCVCVKEKKQKYTVCFVQGKSLCAFLIVKACRVYFCHAAVLILDKSTWCVATVISHAALCTRQQRSVLCHATVLHVSESKDSAYGVFLAKQMSKLLEVGEQGPVMVHCAMGKRAGQLQCTAK